MTIKDLIKKLQEWDEDEQVAFRDSEGFYLDDVYIGWNWNTAGGINSVDRDTKFDEAVIVSLYGV